MLRYAYTSDNTPICLASLVSLRHIYGIVCEQVEHPSTTSVLTRGSMLMVQCTIQVEEQNLLHEKFQADSNEIQFK